MADQPMFMAIAESDPEFRQTVVDAQAGLHDFRRLLHSRASAEWHACIKTRLKEDNAIGFLWLLVVRDTDSGFVPRVFEIPPEFKGIRVGDEIHVSDPAVMDWMVNHSGLLHGGFSLRYQRSKLPAERRAWFDGYIGVTAYAESGRAVDQGGS